jgi:RNA polymerase sigma-70 factor (ECF subfamily)
MRAVMTGPQPMTPDCGDISLIERVAHGDEEAVAVFYHCYADAVFRFVYRRVQERYEDAEEITQDAFLAAVACAATYDRSCAVLTWLCGIARLRITDFYRRQSRRRRIPPGRLFALDERTAGGEGLVAGAGGLDDVPARLDAARLLDQTLASLSDDEREALMMRYVEELSVRDIAALMRRTEKAVESLLMRAKKKAARAATRWL